MSAVGSDELDAGHWGVVALPRPELEDPGIATRSFSVTGRYVGEQLVSHVLVADERDDLALVVDAALFRLRQALLEDRAQRLGLRLRCHEAFAGYQRGHEVAHHGLLVSGIAAEAAALLGTTRDARHLLLPLLPAQRKATLVELLEDLIEGLLPEVRYCQKVVLGLGDKLADGVDLGPLQAVPGPLGQV